MKKIHFRQLHVLGNRKAGTFLNQYITSVSEIQCHGGLSHLVISVTTSNFSIRKILVDSGSSVGIVFFAMRSANLTLTIPSFLFPNHSISVLITSLIHKKYTASKDSISEMTKVHTNFVRSWRSPQRQPWILQWPGIMMSKGKS